ncbi:helix-turn-helix domain-containing protein [Streptomyces sp. NBC_00038]|nr:helix-turn-helix domain-containing protein [Streptomyces sp. NBC_00038]
MAKIAEVTFSSADRVRDVIHNFDTDGFDSLYPKYKDGRPKTFTLPERREIKKIAKCDTNEMLVDRRVGPEHRRCSLPSTSGKFSLLEPLRVRSTPTLPRRFCRKKWDHRDGPQAPLGRSGSPSRTAP